MKYIPITDKQKHEMLQSIGASNIEELFSNIPKEFKINNDLHIPSKLSEKKLINHFENIGKKNKLPTSSFVGGGAYNHYIPKLIDYITGRSELYTCYTPYQPEISQGTLQAIFEFQTLICEIFGLDVTNASMYDGASATAEAILMASRINRKKKAYVSGAIHPNYIETIKTYTKHTLDVEIMPFNKQTGQTDITSLSNEVSSVTISYPNFFGCIEDLVKIREITKKNNILLIVTVPEPISLGILKSPGEFGADIVCGEGQSFGIPVSFGGPYLGLFSAKKEYMRHMPGRIVGETTDLDGKKGYVLTLATREQHIRRERATSNICSNQALCALRACIYLSVLGKEGFANISEINFSNAHYLFNELIKIKGIKSTYSSAFFNEFVISFDKKAEDVHRKLLENNICFGIPLAKFYPEMENEMLVSVTEENTKDEMDRVLQSIGK